MKKSRSFYANNVDAYIPEMWAEAGLMQLQENMVTARLVHRDYQRMFARKGDIINVQRPREFTAYRKARASNITIQDAVGDNVQVKLDQHIHTSFLIHDVDSSKSFKELHDEFLVPAMRALARRFDRLVTGASWRFRANMGGNLASAISRANLLQAREKLVVNKAPETPRYLVIPPAQETTLLGLAEFSEFDKVGDTATLRKASLGERFGLTIYTAQNQPQVLSGTIPVTATGAVNNASGYAAGSTAITVDGFTGNKTPVGSYVVIAGDDRPRRVIATTLTTSNTTAFTLDAGIRTAIVDNAVVTAYGATALVNLAAGYAAGYEERILFDTAGTGKAPQIGQLLSFGVVIGSAEYTVIDVTDAGDGTGSIELDRPLDAAIADNVVINLGPVGAYGFAFHPNCLALCVRPLALPVGGGANSAIADDERIGAGIRVTFAYDYNKQATVCTIDVLAGITTLDTALGALLLSNDVANS